VAQARRVDPAPAVTRERASGHTGHEVAARVDAPRPTGRVVAPRAAPDGTPAAARTPRVGVALGPLLLAFAWGLNWPAIKIVLTAVPPFTLRLLGLGGAALLLAGVALVQGKSLWPPRAAWPGIVVGAVFTITAFNFCTAFAQLNTSTSRAAVLTYTMPMLSAALAWVLLGERPGRRGAWALVLGSAGIGVLAWPVLEGVAQGSGAAPAGLVFPLLAALAWAVGTVAAKRWPPVGERVVVTAWQLGIGGWCGALAAAFTGETLPAAWEPRVVAALTYHIVVANAFAYLLWYRILEALSATVSSLTTLAVPVVGVLGAMALVGDRPSLADWAGFTLVLGGAALVVLRFERAGAARR
jgi:drug/metabolite transporter (DMT)-like permease